jgi:DNA/RNA-binding domain of Phe-tRNA-synthetase-like protein
VIWCISAIRAKFGKTFPYLSPARSLPRVITKDASVGPQIARYNAIAQSRLATSSEGQLPAKRAWRRAFSRMGLKPTHYRCASESLLRRFRKEKFLPEIHPLIDLCNAISLAFAIPVAAFDVAKIAQCVEVRRAGGCEVYLAFSGEVENPEAHEVIFTDNAGRAHARRWTNRQSAYSAVRDETNAVLIVTEAMHDAAPADMSKLIAALPGEISVIWSVTPKTMILSRSGGVKVSDVGANAEPNSSRPAVTVCGRGWCTSDTPHEQPRPVWSGRGNRQRTAKPLVLRGVSALWDCRLDKWVVAA